MNYAYTIGQWLDEASSAQALDLSFSEAGLWHVYREVPGMLSQPRPSQLERTLRIDRVLLPTQRLLDLGWKHGAVGIEVKRSGVKIGPPIAQAMDYSRAVWTLPGLGVKVWLDWVFLWPMDRQTGAMASILAQNRIGCAYSSKWIVLHLKSGEANLIKIDRDGRIDIGEARNGQKVGSR